MKRLMILFMLTTTLFLTAASISGEVETMVPDSLLTVTVLQAENPQNSQSVEVQDGSYIAEELEYGTYFVKLHSLGFHLFYDGVFTMQEATPIELTEENADVTEINFVFEVSEYGVISGNVYGLEEPLEGIVKLYDQQPSETGVEAISEYVLEDSHFEFTELEFNTYYVALFLPEEDPIYYEDTLNPEEAEEIVISVEEPVADGIDFEMQENAEFGIIYGNVSAVGQGPGGQVDGVVKLYDQQPSEPTAEAIAETELFGNHFTFSQLEFGIYYVGLFLAEDEPLYYEETTNPAEADPIELTPEDPIADDIEFDLDENPGTTMIAGFIEGVNMPNSFVVALYDQQPVNPEIQPISEKMVTGFHYAFHNVAQGTYYLKCYNDMGNEQYYDGETDPNNADAVEISEEEPIALGINFEMEGEVNGSGIITGTVTNENAEPLFEAVVHLHSVNNGGNQGGMPSFPRNTHTAEDGSYSLENIAAGDYFLRVTKDGHSPVFYENSSHWQEATVITITGNTQLNIDFVMQSMETYEISGTVLNYEGIPIEDAIVFAKGTNCENQGNLFNLNGPTAITDDEGNYSLELAIGDYIIGAFFISETQQLIQFYDHKTNPLEADIVAVEGDLEDIDFDFAESVTYENSLSGVVSLAGEPAENAMVVVMSSDQSYATTVISDENGFYEFNSLPEREYYIAANTENGINTFYPGVINFQNAETVDISGIVTNVNFEIIPHAGGGYFTVDGFVSSPSRAPVANTTVSFTDSYGNVIAAAETNANGYYVIDEMISGDIEGLATKIFYESDTTIMEVDGDTTVDFTIQPAEPTSNQSTPDISDFISTHNYPNPFNPITTIKFDIPQKTNVKVTVFNVKGEKVTTLVNSELNSGSHSVIWNGKDRNNNSVASGVYFYQVKTANSTAVRKIMMIK